MKNQISLVLSLILTLTILNACTGIDKEDFSIEAQDTGMTGSMRGLDVLNENCVWISGSGGEYSFTTDGGSNWNKGVVPGAESLDFRDVHVFSVSSALLMSAGPGEASRIYRTDDGGKNWEMTFMNTDSLGFFDGMDFLNENEGIMFSDPVDSKLNLLVTKDGGRNWARLNPALLPELKKGEYAFAASGTSLCYDWDGGIWIATGGLTARIWHAYSLDGPWEVTTPPVISGDPAAGLFSIAVKSELKKIAVGGHYQEMDIKGENAVVWDEEKLTWVISEGSKILPFMECVRWISNDGLIAVGPPGVFYSPDSGMNWEKIAEEGYHTFDVSEKGKVGWMALNEGNVSKISW